jgi:uncharacterized protein
MARDRTEPMRCPNCGSRLVELDRSEVLIDACPECRGVWLDRGELDRILDRERRAASGVRDDDEDFFEEMGGTRSQPQSPPREQYREPHPGQHKKRKKRSLLEDLFDFD